jgi:hypothetical protein
MEPIDFKERTHIIAENQPQYLPLPAFVSEGGTVISCWKMTFRERIRVLFTGKLWLTVLTFNKPLQPQLPEVKRPLTLNLKFLENY